MIFHLSDMSGFSPRSVRDQEVRVGHAAIFDLPAISSVPSPAVTWHAEDNTMLYGTKYASTSDNKLIILSVDSSDEKRYRSGLPASSENIPCWNEIVEFHPRRAWMLRGLADMPKFIPQMSCFTKLRLLFLLFRVNERVFATERKMKQKSNFFISF